VHIGAKLAQLALAYPDRTAIVDEAGSWSLRQFHQRLTRFGNAMHGLGVAKGDRIALLLPDCREYLEADYGSMAAGFVRVPMDPRLTRRELVALLRRAGVRVLVTHPAFAETIHKLDQDVETLQSILYVGKGLDYETLLEKSSERPLPDGDGDDLATLNFSGGTTGVPKAVMLRHRNLMAVAANTIRGFEIASETVFLNVRPLWPIAQVILMSHLFAGATVVLRGRFDAERFTATIDRSGATRTSLVPTQLVFLIDFSFFKGLGAFAFGTIARRNPCVAASRRRSSPFGTGRISPESPTSPNATSFSGNGRSRKLDCTASSTGRSAAVSCTRMPPIDRFGRLIGSGAASGSTAGGAPSCSVVSGNAALAACSALILP